MTIVTDGASDTCELICVVRRWSGWYNNYNTANGGRSRKDSVAFFSDDTTALDPRHAADCQRKGSCELCLGFCDTNYWAVACLCVLFGLLFLLCPFPSSFKTGLCSYSNIRRLLLVMPVSRRLRYSTGAELWRHLPSPGESGRGPLLLQRRCGLFLFIWRYASRAQIVKDSCSGMGQFDGCGGRKPRPVYRVGPKF